jgi:FdhD protein
MTGANHSIHYFTVENGLWKAQKTEIIVETPVSLTVNGDIWLTFMCTPVDLEALALGFLFNEGLIQSLEEVASVRVCPALDNVDVWLYHEAHKPDSWRRTSGCTGGATSVAAEESGALADFHLPGSSANGFTITAAQVGQMIGQLFAAQDLYRRSGGVHTSVLSDGQQIYASAEDIGRHNTLDKLAGRCLLEQIALPRSILLTTGRVSSEMLQKALRLGAAMVISRTSPSSLSIRMAERGGITLIGYAHRERFNVYSHPERILSSRADLVFPAHAQDTGSKI